MRTLALWGMLGAACACAAPTTTVEPGSAPSGSSRTFLDKSLAIIRNAGVGITTLAARVTLTQRTPGMGEPVTSDCRVEFQATNVLRKEVRGQYPYSVFISNGTVTTEFPGTNARDVRPLAAQEDVLADFLGMCTFPDEAAFSFEFSVEGTLHVVAAVLRPRQRQDLSRNLVANAGVAVKRTIWIDPDKRRIVKTCRVTLGQTEETCEFRSLWINTPMPATEGQP